MPELGEPEDPPEAAEATAERLRSTSLLEQVDLLVRGATAAPPQSAITRCTRRRRIHPSALRR